MVTAERLDGIDEYFFSKKLREIEIMNLAGKEVINLGIGSPDLPPHPMVVDTLYAESLKSQQHGYQNYKGHIILRNAISTWYKKYYNVTLDAATEILPLIGSKEGIMHVCMTFLNKGDKVLIPNPGYPTYTSVAKIAGATCIDYLLTETNNWFPDLNSLEASDLSGVKLMFVNYPQMPTGQLPTKELFESLVAFAKKYSIIICHDNPYSFILNPSPMSMLSVDGAMDVVVELNSLSKSHNMAGWRVGMLVGREQIISQVLRFKSNMDSGMFLPLQLAAARALELGQDWFDQLNQVYEKRRKKVFGLLEILNCSFDQGQAGMFVWAKIPPSFINSFVFSEEILTQANVFITPGGIFGSEGEQFVRVSLCSPEEKIELACGRIQSFFKFLTE